MGRLEARLEASGRSINTTNTIAFRDAHDRADNLNDADDALPVLKRALRSNDPSLALAIFRRAIDAGWTTVTDAFIAENPGLSDVVRDLHKSQGTKDSTMGRTMSYGTWGERAGADSSRQTQAVVFRHLKNPSTPLGPTPPKVSRSGSPGYCRYLSLAFLSTVLRGSGNALGNLCLLRKSDTLHSSVRLDHGTAPG